MTNEEKLQTFIDMFDMFKEPFEEKVTDKKSVEQEVSAIKDIVKEVYEIDKSIAFGMLKYVGVNNPDFALQCYFFCNTNYSDDANYMLNDVELSELFFKKTSYINYDTSALLGEIFNSEDADNGIRIVNYLFERNPYYTERYCTFFNVTKKVQETISKTLTDALDRVKKPIKSWTKEVIENIIASIPDKKEKALMMLAYMKKA